MKFSGEQSPKTPETIEFEVGIATSPSVRHPDRNDDTALSLPGKGSFGVFDGVGGYEGGEVASNMAKEILQKKLEELPDSLFLEERLRKIREYTFEVNRAILNRADEDPNLYKMGTTISFTQIFEDLNGKRELLVANSGDSRVYILRKGRVLEKITLDDNTFSMEIQKKFDNITNPNQLSANEQELFIKRNTLRTFAGREGFDPHIRVLDLFSNDIIIITSDGIHDNLTSSEIANIVAGKEANALKAQKLMNAAIEKSREKSFRSKPDDMTAVVISEKI